VGCRALLHARSLSALGDVIASLQTKSKHVPYRNSKLTCAAAARARHR
jgi:hypothetical protein